MIQFDLRTRRGVLLVIGGVLLFSLVAGFVSAAFSDLFDYFWEVV